MLKQEGVFRRSSNEIIIDTNFSIVGGGMAGVCAAITAARQGIKVVLVQDRPVLGGNASSEVRLWILGATSHMGNNNRWAREGGVINEILIENVYRNREGNPLIFDSILLEKITEEKNITLLLNTAVFDIEKDGDRISTIHAFCSQNSTKYIIRSTLFCDASGDGQLAFLAGAAFRMGAEEKSEFNEKFAPSKEYGELLGHSLYFYTKNSGRPVKYTPPSFALKDLSGIARYRKISSDHQGCNMWWLEYGGRLDTVHDTEKIKWELWKVVYGLWNYIKNSGKFPEAENLTLEWVGTIPGKRESRRFEGDYMLTQQDIIEQKYFEDAVAFGGWSIDLHPADGVFSDKPACNQWHSKGVYTLPYRCFYSKNVSNLFLAGRIISASHVAFGSSRVMGTCAHGAQAVGVAAALCLAKNSLPSEIGKNNIKELQQELLKTGQHIPGLILEDHQDLVRSANSIHAKSLLLSSIPKSGNWMSLADSMGQMLPVSKGKMNDVTFWVRSEQETQLEIELRKSSKSFNHTPDIILEKHQFAVEKGENEISISFKTEFAENCYAFICLLSNPVLEVAISEKRISGILSVFNGRNPAVSNYGKQEPVEDIGVDTFEFWCPARRPGGQNMALDIYPALDLFRPENIRNGLQRPISAPNVWAADIESNEAELTIEWSEDQKIRNIELSFDPDYDNPMENVLLYQHDTIQPFCVRDFEVIADGEVIYSFRGNYQVRHSIILDSPISTNALTFNFKNPDPHVPVAVFEIRCYE